MERIWKGPFAFTKHKVKQVPRNAGVYIIMQSKKYPRYFGSTDILKIGKSNNDLQSELENHFIRHTAANRLIRINNRNDIEVSFEYYETEDATSIEKKLLREFEDQYWDLPVLNSNRGYNRAEDKHYRSLSHSNIL